MRLQTDNDDKILMLIREPSTCEMGFRMLMMKYREKVYWHIRRIVHYHEDADDVTQNTFVKIYRNIDSFKGTSKLYTWIYRIATNESITHVNKQKNKHTASLDNEENYLENELKADDFFDGNEAQRLLKKAIMSLPEKQRIVFNMRYYDEIPYAEMSQILETSEGALKASYHLAVKKISAMVKA